jgi:hypothetical protein
MLLEVQLPVASRDEEAMYTLAGLALFMGT